MISASRLWRLAAAVMLACVACASPLNAAVFDASGDYSPTSNPNGVWQYGWRANAVSTDFQAYGLRGQFQGGIDYWYTQSYSNGLPDVGHNGTSNTITESAVTWAPGQLSLHPEYRTGYDPIVPAYSVVRWLAPTDGIYLLDASFVALSTVASADVHVVLNGQSLFDDTILGPSGSRSYTSSFSMLSGDRLDFVVGDGGTQPVWANGDNDTVGLSATVSAVPEPTTFIIWSGLCAAWLAVARMKKKHQAA